MFPVSHRDPTATPAAAALTGGVLRIDLPRSPEAKPRKITLKMD